MSATRDPSEKITFLFSPMAGLVRKIKETPIAPAPAASVRKPVIRHQQRSLDRTLARPSMAVREHRARELTTSIPQAASALFQRDQHAGLAGLRQSLGELDQLQKRFRFLIQELEDLIQD